MYLTFAEQVRVILRQREMTIEQLADKLGVSRQNLNQKLNRNNFDERTMRSIAIALECDFFVSLNGINVGGNITIQQEQKQPKKRGVKTRKHLVKSSVSEQLERNDYVEETDGRTAEEIVLQNFLDDPATPEEQRVIARKFPPMEGEGYFYYTKRIMDLESTMQNENKQ